MKGYPPRFPALLWTACATAFASGLLLAPTTLAMRVGWPVPWRLPSDARLLAAASHAAASFVLLMVVGALWTIHMRVGWRRGRQRVTGATLVSGVAGLVLSALGVYYLGDSELAGDVALVHVSLGVLLALPLAVHATIGKQQRLQRSAGAGPDPQPRFAGTVLLADLPEGACATVAAVAAASPDVDALVLRRLGELGFIPGEPVELLRRGPGGREPIAVLVGETLFALRLLEAQCIAVHPL
ncbi:FeoA family protein [Piscinibacter sp. XHJ-5]|uniref:FeoA family protein n=1 Tax=Piscinibacter sp. XHJ-5 TaxID=3037797 RepID=UPI0024533D80|nr:FeoA family protein [Piscinibacter sp. XHJ-5]